MLLVTVRRILVSAKAKVGDFIGIRNFYFERLGCSAETSYFHSTAYEIKATAPEYSAEFVPLYSAANSWRRAFPQYSSKDL